MIRSPLRLIAWVREPGLGLRLWRGLAATTDAEVELTLARDRTDLFRCVRGATPHLVLLDLAGDAGEGNGRNVQEDLDRIRFVLATAPGALVLLAGGGARRLRARLGDLGHPVSRVVLLEDLLGPADPGDLQPFGSGAKRV